MIEKDNSLLINKLDIEFIKLYENIKEYRLGKDTPKLHKEVEYTIVNIENILSMLDYDLMTIKKEFYKI